MRRPSLLALCLFACLASPAAGQTASEPGDSADVLVLDHDFGVVGELVRLFLVDRQVYRAELSTIDVTLQLKPRFPGMRVPRVYPVSGSRSPSGSSIVEIYPDQDGEYEIRPVSIRGSQISTRLRLYRDVGESRRRLGTHQPGWKLGIELAGGWHSGLARSSAVAAPGTSPDAGTDIEACFTTRNASSASRLHVCVLGLGHQSQQGAKSVLWLYTEPRVKILGGARPGLSNWEMGALLRFGVGIISAASITPTTVAPGLYVARHIRRNSGGAAWSLQASYSHAFYRGFAAPTSAASENTPRSHRLSFGVGWYR